MSNNIKVDDLVVSIRKELDNYQQVVVTGTKNEAKKAIDKLVKQTKTTAPTRRPKYKKSITSKKTWETPLGVGYMWYVKSPEHRLSHLLEKGHATRDGKRTKAFKFISKATEDVKKEYLKAVEEVLKNG